MLRGGGGGSSDLIGGSISPPPEFQDEESIIFQVGPRVEFSEQQSELITPVPPPTGFRDLTPSPSSSSCGKGIPSLSLHCRLRLVQDFAEKFTLNVLSEAMIIAAVVPEAGTDFTSDVCPAPISFSSDSYDGKTLSTTTSWEYLGKEGQVQIRSSNSSDKGASRRLTSGECSTSGASTDVFSERVENDPAMMASIHNESNTSHPNVTCDLIYSLPVDNVPSTTQVNSTQEPSLCISVNGSRSPNISTSTSTRNDSLRHSNLSCLPQNSKPLEGTSEEATRLSRNTWNSRALRLKNNNQRYSLDLQNETTWFVSSQRKSTSTRGQWLMFGDGNNNRETHKASSNASVEPSHFWTKKKRSKSVELESLDEGSDSAYKENASHQTNPDGSSKEKKTFGDAILKLFRRRKLSISKNSSRIKIQDPDMNPDPNNAGAGTETKEGMDITVSAPRALPLPPDQVKPNFGSTGTISGNEGDIDDREPIVDARDFAASIEHVIDCGWYWGPLSSEEAEDLLRGEPDGSFIVRDSSDIHYIFSLTFKLNGLIRHVRIEHDQGNFSFGPLTRFKAATIVDFVEKAVAHSRSGRYLFFLHRRPVLGPMRVQLLHPYSRFRHPRSLQHMCRFAILKQVRKDLVGSLPLPKPLLNYLNSPHYYFDDKELGKKSHSSK